MRGVARISVMRDVDSAVVISMAKGAVEVGIDDLGLVVDCCFRRCIGLLLRTERPMKIRHGCQRSHDFRVLDDSNIKDDVQAVGGSATCRPERGRRW
jgi:hypothetical protein